MTQKSLSKWLKGIILGITVCGIIIYGFLIPMFGKDLAVENPEFAHCYYPWLVMLWISAIPCCLGLYHGWKITVEIAGDNSLSHPAVLLASLFVDFAGVVVAVMAAALSHLVLKAAKIQQENQLTI